MPDLEGTRTHANLAAAFARECQTSLLLAYFARVAEAEGQVEVAAACRDLATADAGHAHGVLDHLKRAGGPLGGQPFGNCGDNLEAAVAMKAADHRDTYPEMARIARAEGFAAAADWFEMLARSEGVHVARLEDLRRRLGR